METRAVNAIVKASPVEQNHGLIPRNMQDAMQLATMMARGKMMPEHLRNDGDALMVIEQAMRWNMSPFAVAQSTFSIKGKLLFAGTLVAAAIENSGAIQGLMDYQFTGEGPTRKITVSATRRGEATPRTVEVLLKDAKTTNENWTKQPDQQLVYHGARVWARRWTPGVMLGVYTPEEMRDIPPDTGTTRELYTGTTLEHVPDAAPKSTPAPSPAPKRTRRMWLDELQVRLSAVQNEDELGEIAQSPEVVRALETFQNGHLTDLKAMLADTFERVSATVHDAETGEVEVEADFPGDRA
jgi:hypothetical protein